VARVVWKGAIAFGLVNVPVDLYPGSKDSDLDFDWIDRRDMAPVGYQRINKSTGEPVDMKDIVKGYEYEKGNYVVLTDEDFKAANPKATQTVELLAFVDREAILPQYFERPYRLAPGKRGEKGYALLRETLKRTNKVGVAQVVIRAKQHLAVLMPIGDMLELITMRYAEEVLDAKEFDLPSLKEAKVSDKEVALAERLVEDMTEAWEPAKYEDTYRDDLMKRIEELATKGRTHAVKKAGKDEEGGAKIIDLMAALKRSLERGDGKAAKGAAGRKHADAKPARKRAASPKSRSRSAVRSATRKRA
jgi:DNA end-binding protein Ku